MVLILRGYAYMSRESIFHILRVGCMDGDEKMVSIRLSSRPPKHFICAGRRQWLIVSREMSENDILCAYNIFSINKYETRLPASHERITVARPRDGIMHIFPSCTRAMHSRCMQLHRFDVTHVVCEKYCESVCARITCSCASVCVCVRKK